MKTKKFNLQKLTLLLALLMFLGAPSLKVYSFVGEYDSNSLAIEAWDSANSETFESGAPALAVAAVSAALWAGLEAAYQGGRLVGKIAHHAYHLFKGELPLELALLTVDYHPMDFSEFDN